MKIAVPVEEYRGLESTVYGHFGSAPVFALVDPDTLEIQPLDNQNQEHVHGACQPMRALAGARPDAVVVGGIGGGALFGLRNAGIKVYRFRGGTVADAVALWKAGQLEEMEGTEVCGGHGGHHGCHHG